MLEAVVGKYDPAALEKHAQDKEALLLSGVDHLLSQGETVGVGLDYDQNVSLSGPKSGLDPRESYIHPEAKQALIDIQNAGGNVVVISSRGARDVAEKVGVPGASYVGSLGWEAFVTNQQDPTAGVSLIHPRFRPFQHQITSILGEVRERFVSEQLGGDPTLVDDPNLEFPTRVDGSKVILQRKGFNSEYPEGINLTWALNMITPEERVQYVEALQRYYDEAFESQAEGLSDIDKAKLKEMCGIKTRPGFSNEGVPTFDFEIRPVAQGAKGEAMLQLLRPVGDPKRAEHFQPMPHSKYWVYSGDHLVQDGAVMVTGQRAYNLTKGQGGVFGIWTRPPLEVDTQVPGYVDVVVNGVPGNAVLLTKLADVYKKHAA